MVKIDLESARGILRRIQKEYKALQEIDVLLSFAARTEAGINSEVEKYEQLIVAKDDLHKEIVRLEEERLLAEDRIQELHFEYAEAEVGLSRHYHDLLEECKSEHKTQSDLLRAKRDELRDTISLLTESLKKTKAEVVAVRDNLARAKEAYSEFKKSI